MSPSPFGVAIIGCGLIGKRRAGAVVADAASRLIIVADTNRQAAQELGQRVGCRVTDDAQEAMRAPGVDIVVVATPNAVAVPLGIAALQQGKHLLIEKPLGRNSQEAERLVTAAGEHPRHPILKTGFNHRFHAAIRQARHMVEEGTIGRLLTIRARYGHGGRPGMEKEWRVSKELCGGGELLDQGVHLVDLIRWFAGEIREVYGRVETLFWEIGVEDNAFAVLKTASNVTAHFHVSWTNWRNVFSLEIFGTLGYLAMHGLGGSYGAETLEWGRRKSEGGVPDIQQFAFPEHDLSWQAEWTELTSSISSQRAPIGSGTDGLMANRVIEAIYESAKLRQVVTLS